MVRIRKKTRIRISVLCLTIAVCIYFKEEIHNFLEPERGVWFENRKKLISNFQKKKSLRRYSVNENYAAVCDIPNLDPFEENALWEWSYRRKAYCNAKKLGLIENGKLVVNGSTTDNNPIPPSQTRLHLAWPQEKSGWKFRSANTRHWPHNGRKLQIH